MKRFALVMAFVPAWAAGAITPEQEAFFESEIRPVLASACYDCHGAVRQKSGLRLDWREGLLKGGERGPAIVPGDPDKSLLAGAIAHSHAELKMPKNAGRLSAATVDAFREWIRMGAPDPRDKLPAAESAQASDWPSVFALRKQWWCWQPLRNSEPPAVPGTEHPVDRFLRDAMRQAGISPAPPADPATLVRRISFILTGLPPSPEEVESLTRACAGADPSTINSQLSTLTDRLLASPQFGQRWARHWMDWLRYAESHGSEGDPAVPYAWRYRDYLIRALNADVPYPQLVREHIAGDLLPPRLSADGQLNDAAIGPAHLRMVFHGFTPTDALDEFVTFTDNQVDVVSKAFMGLTVSCARCHNHKFDAISQEDYYALYGIFANCRPAVRDAAAHGKKEDVHSLLDPSLNNLQMFMASAWRAAVADLPARMRAWQPATEAIRKEADGDGTGPLAAWLRLKGLAPADAKAAWDQLRRKREEISQKRTRMDEAEVHVRWKGGERDGFQWFTDGPGVDWQSGTWGFFVASEENRIVGSVRPAGWYSDFYSSRCRGVVLSQRFKCEGGRLWVRAAGKNATLRYVVHHYPRSGLIFPKEELKSDAPVWISWNMDYWKGEMISIEAATNPDAPVESSAAQRPWFGIMEVFYPKDASIEPPRSVTPLHWILSGDTPPDQSQLEWRYHTAIQDIIFHWPKLGITNDRAEFLDFFIRAGILPNTVAELPDAAGLLKEYREQEAELPEPIRVPGVMEADAFDQPLYIRGDHKKPGAPVPRRFLEAIDPAPYNAKDSGRRELAESLVSGKNPLTSRVIVNRLWHHVFGRGIVATPDNFGKLGEPPTHPELLDWLALRFQKDGGSIKQTLKLLLTSQAFQAESAPSPEAAEKDPENKLLSHWTLRRMEAEAIRDAILSVSGKLDATTYEGPSVDGSGPRRSVYVKVIRNALDPFLTAFDAPVPSSTRGRRDATNVPAQALALVNSPMIQSWANAWADRVCQKSADEAGRVRQLFLTGFSREPSAAEVAQCLAHVHEAAGDAERMKTQVAALQQRLAAAERERRTLFDPVRDHLQNERNKKMPDVSAAPQPVAEWDFENDAGDRKGALHLKLHGTAKVQAGALVLDGAASFASSPPLTHDLRAKTLEAWVQLDTLDQAGGGVMSVQSTDGVIFDAIVFAEQNQRQWLPGSNNFQRTRSTGGPEDAEASGRPVHVALTYAADGTITLWRDGKLYGQPYKSSGPVNFAAGKTNILLGLRHGEPGGNRLLKGRILRARLYDRSLTEKEIAVSSQLEGGTVLHADVLTAMTADIRTRYEAADRTAVEARQQLAALTAAGPLSPDAAWRSLALALINMKEFIYLR